MATAATATAEVAAAAAAAAAASTAKVRGVRSAGWSGGNPFPNPHQSSSCAASPAFFMEARTILTVRSSGVEAAATSASFSLVSDS